MSRTVATDEELGMSGPHPFRGRSRRRGSQVNGAVCRCICGQGVPRKTRFIKNACGADFFCAWSEWGSFVPRPIRPGLCGALVGPMASLTASAFCLPLAAMMMLTLCWSSPAMRFCASAQTVNMEMPAAAKISDFISRLPRSTDHSRAVSVLASTSRDGGRVQNAECSQRRQVFRHACERGRGRLRLRLQTQVIESDGS